MTVLLPLANHLWQSTLFAVAAALLALALRRQRAETRHRLWLAASMKFLVPLAPLIELGNRIEWRSAPVVAAPVSAAVTQIGEPFTTPGPGIAVSAPAGWWWMPAVIGAIWVAGCAVALWRWGRQWRAARATVRAATPLPIEGPVPVRSSASRIEPGVFGVWRPVVLLPAGIEERLSAEQLRAVLAHEFCHARRRDNLWAALHMVVESAFWFHPLVRWIGTRLVDERERACDEDVVRRGNDPEVYASGILDVCRLYLESPLTCASGVTGADLEKRIRSIMRGGSLARLTASHKAMLACAAAAAVGGPIAVGVLQGQARPPLRFEVASIKKAKREATKGSLQLLPGGGLSIGGVTVKGLIAMAFDVRESQIAGGPKWMEQDVYTVLAKAEKAESAAATDQPVTTAPGTTAWERLRERLQTLLTERCKLTVRKESKESAGYDLIVAKGGFKLTPTTNPLPAGTVRGYGEINGRSGTMKMLATVLSQYVGKPVADRTGQAGNYDYKLTYADDSAGPEAPVTEGASVFTALQEQLGVKLEPARVAVATIVVERVERPSEN